VQKTAACLALRLTFVLNFSDETIAILTQQELLEEFLDRRITAKGFTHMLSA
jgi:hypothetical protein